MYPLHEQQCELQSSLFSLKIFFCFVHTYMQLIWKAFFLISKPQFVVVIFLKATFTWLNIIYHCCGYFWEIPTSFMSLCVLKEKGNNFCRGSLARKGLDYLRKRRCNEEALKRMTTCYKLTYHLTIFLE